MTEASSNEVRVAMISGASRGIGAATACRAMQASPNSW